MHPKTTKLPHVEAFPSPSKARLLIDHSSLEERQERSWGQWLPGTVQDSLLLQHVDSIDEINKTQPSTRTKRREVWGQASKLAQQGGDLRILICFMQVIPCSHVGRKEMFSTLLLYSPFKAVDLAHEIVQNHDGNVRQNGTSSQHLSRHILSLLPWEGDQATKFWPRRYMQKEHKTSEKCFNVQTLHYPHRSVKTAKMWHFLKQVLSNNWLFYIGRLKWTL